MASRITRIQISARFVREWVELITRHILNTHWIEDASYVRGEGCNTGIYYSVKVSADWEFYFTAKNFFLITKYSGYDPEGSDSGNEGDALTPNMDFYMYPRPTTYTFGVNVAF